MGKQHPPQPQTHAMHGGKLGNASSTGGQLLSVGSVSAHAPHSALRPKMAHSSKTTPRNVHIRPSLCKTFTVVAEEYSVPLSDATGFIPMDRRCLVRIYERTHVAKGAILLVHGFASNRSMFNIGGGNGKSGPSFFEYLASRGFDTYAIDMRGTRESLSMGSAAPAYIKEHIEVDVPSAIACIKRLGHEKVYLVGHSMGGAISCAVAGRFPHDVAGVVHLAGLYHLTIPILGDVVDLYRANCPQVVQNIIQAGTSLAVRSLFYYLSPALHSISGALSPNEPVVALPPYHRHLVPSNPPRTISSSAQYAVTYIRRQRVPIRPVVEALLYIRRFLPTAVSQAVMNMLYPSPWLPYSVEDPGTLTELSLESPTVGIMVSVGKLALNSDLNQWLESSSAHRAEIPQGSKETKNSPDDRSGDLKKLRENSNSPKQIIPSGCFTNILCDGASFTSVESRPPEWGPISDGASDGDDEDSLPEDESQLLIKAALSRIRGTSSAGSHAPLPDLTLQIGAEPPEPKVVKSIKREVEAAAKELTQKGEAHFMQGWDELGPYLEQFERLEHLPLFFCPANADQILRTEDSMAGYRRSGSKWKDSIVYCDISIDSTTKLNTAINSQTSTSPALSLSKLDTLSLSSDGTAAASRMASHLSPSTQVYTATNLFPSSPEKLKRVSSGSSFVKSTLFSPALSTGVLVAAGPHKGATSPIVRPPANVLQIEEDSKTEGKAREPKAARLFGPEYSVPSSYKYGHCDILGGQHAEQVWHRIADWLDVTAAREKEWRFRRRYSAK